MDNPNRPSDGDSHRINLNRGRNLMHDIKAPIAKPPVVQQSQMEPSAQFKNTAASFYNEPINYIAHGDETPIQKRENLQKNSHKKLYGVIGIFLILLLVVGGFGFYFYKKSNALSQINEINTEEGIAELDKAVIDIGKVAVLPINDSPTLFVVSDPEQLKADAFFDSSKSGDQMLLYPRIGFAILYRPISGQIVNMMKFNPAPENNSGTSTSATSSGATMSATSTIFR